MGFLQDLQQGVMSAEGNYPRMLTRALGVTGRAVEPVWQAVNDVTDPLLKGAEGMLSNAYPAYDAIKQGAGMAMDAALNSDLAAQAVDAYKQNVPPVNQQDLTDIKDAALNLAPLAMGGRALGMKGNPLNKGQALTEGDLYVKGFYRPADVSFSDAFEARVKKAEANWKAAQKMSPEEVNNTFSMAERAEMNILGRQGTDKRSGAVGNPVVDRMRTASGFLDWGTTGVVRAVQGLVDPKARAMYAEYGVNQVDLEAVGRWKRAQQKLESLEEKKRNGESVSAGELAEAKRAVPNALAEAQQQLQATANIRRQAENQGASVNDMLDEIARAASDPDVLKITGKPYIPLRRDTNWFNDIVRPTIDETTQKRFSSVDADVMQRHIFQSQKPRENAEVIVKRASSKETGKHWEDLFQNNTSLDPVADAFVQLKKDTGRLKFDSNEELISYLSKQQKAVGKGKNFYVKFDDPNAIENANGVWITMSKTGTAKVEGAINTLYRVDRDGNLVGMMSDKHDMLDGAQGLKQILNKELPTDVIAITKPLSYSIFNSRATKFKKFDDAPSFSGETGRIPQAKQEGSFRGSIEDRLNTISELQPSAKGVAEQQRYLMGKYGAPTAAAGVATATNDPENVKGMLLQ